MLYKPAITLTSTFLLCDTSFPTEMVEKDMSCLLGEETNSSACDEDPLAADDTTTMHQDSFSS